MKKTTKILISLIMCMTLVLPALTDAIVSQAATTETVYEEYTNVSDYRGETKTHPTKAGYLFAGWYKKAGDSYQPMDVVDADGAGSAYAKFVDANVLATKCQLQIGTTASSDTANMRVLTSVDSLYYDAIKFDVEIGGTPVEYVSSTAYESIIGNVDGAEVTYKANEVFAGSSEYFVTFVLQNIPTSEFAAPIKLTSEWTTLDGTSVSGASRSITINNEVPDWNAGIDFESSMDFTVISGQGGDNDATIQRLTYASAGIAVPADGGNYVLKLSHESFRWPTLRINFDKTLPVGTKIQFQAYGKITKGENQYNQSIFEYSAGGEATAQFKCDQWTNLTITLANACSYVDLYWNIDRAGFTGDEGAGEVYIDNMVAIEPIALDLTAGTGFETPSEVEYITGQGADNDANIRRLAYSVLGVDAPANGGTYALKLSHDSNRWPKLQINLGKILPAGTKIQFQAYGKVTKGENLYNQSIFEFDGAGGSGEATAQFKCDQWTDLVITLQEATSVVKLYWNIDRAGFTGDESAGEVYIDNMIAVEPTVFDLTVGTGFESADEVKYVTGQGADNDANIRRLAYSVLGVDAPENGGSYALKLSHDTNRYPCFSINFGKELVAGTVISFQAYGKITGGEYLYNQSAFEVSAGSSGVIGGDIDAYGQIAHDGWKNITVTLGTACDSINLFWNFDRANFSSTDASGEVYIDNMIAVEPVVLDIIAGTGFENAGDEAYVSGADQEGRDATVERATYETLGIGAPTNGGTYALKLSHASNYWPTFRINFGKELASGTVISFQVYGKFTSGTYNYSQAAIEPLTSGSATIGGDLDSYGQFALEGWKAITVTLSTAADYIDLFWNIDRAGITSSSASSEIYIDNMVATDIMQGIDFEQTTHTSYITGGGYWNDFTVERVTYTDAGITVLDGGDSYVMKMTNGNSLWPSIQFNFGKTLPAGTKISFKAYGKINGDFLYNRSKFEFHHDSGSGDAGNEFTLNEWCDVTIVLPSATSYIQMCWNMDHSGGVVEGTETGELYIDNMIAVEPITLNLVSGTGFELAGEEDYITTPGASGRDATIERATFDSLGVGAPTEGGTYALKLSHASNYWPTFRINFGKELAAGSTISFQVYGKFTSGTYNYSQAAIEVYSGSATIGGELDQYGQFQLEGWKTITVTLGAAADHIDLFWNIDRASITSSSASSEIYIDNMIATEP